MVGTPIVLTEISVYGGMIFIYMILLGVGIDFDHFLVARFNRGDWKNARRCIDNPMLVFGGQEKIFDSGDLWRDQRLLSHLIIGGLLCTGLYPIDQYWAFATAVTVYTHLLADLYADGKTREAYLSRNLA